MPLIRLFRTLLGRSTGETVLEAPGADPGDTFQGLIAALPDGLTWEWDDRLNCVLAPFAIADQDAVFNALTSQFGPPWDHSSIGKAPRSVNQAVENVGGVSQGQLIFALTLSQDLILVALWWPWGNGETISIRFAPFGPDASSTENHAVRSAMMDVFGF